MLPLTLTTINFSAAKTEVCLYVPDFRSPVWLGEGSAGHRLFQQGPGLTKHSLLLTGTCLLRLPPQQKHPLSPPHHPAQPCGANPWTQGSASPRQDLRSSVVTSAISTCSITSFPSLDTPQRGDGKAPPPRGKHSCQLLKHHHANFSWCFAEVLPLTSHSRTRLTSGTCPGGITAP